MQAKFLVGGVALTAAFVGLITVSMRGAALQSIPVADLRAADVKTENYVGKRLRVVGFVGKGPLRKTAEQTAQGLVSIAHFNVVEGKSTLAVSYSDALPDTFRAGGPVQVDGIYKAPGVMEADHVLTKCPSKYQAGESAGKGAAEGMKAAEIPVQKTAS